MKNKGEILGIGEGPIEKLPKDFWKNATIVYPRTKAAVHLRIDRNILDYFKSQGKGHLTRMNAVLKAYVEAQNGNK
jgi:uncharacterized protein (DUF4415 family)